MNRAPGPRDPWWAEHQATCGGTFIKTKEPEGYGKKSKESEGRGNKGGAKKRETSVKSKDISKMFKTSDSKRIPEVTVTEDLATGREERRNKMAEAALRRMEINQKRGVPTIKPHSPFSKKNIPPSPVTPGGTPTTFTGDTPITITGGTPITFTIHSIKTIP